MKKHESFEAFIEYERERHAQNPYMKHKDFGNDEIERRKVIWRYMHHFKKVLQGYHDRGEIRTLLNGHCSDLSDATLLNYSMNPTELGERFAWKFSFLISKEDQIKKVEAGEPWEHWFMVDVGPYCSVCDTTVYFETTGQEIRPDEEFCKPCPYPDGIPPFKTELKVPSGKIVYLDDLRPWYEEVETTYDRPGINSIAGRKRLSLQYEAVNLAVGVVGNSMPYIYRKGDSEIFLGKGEFAPEDTDRYGDRRAPAGWEEIDYICTDLWWYMLADYDDWVARGGETLAVEYKTAKHFAVKPGVYEVIHHEHDRPLKYGNDGYKWAELRWVREVG